MSNNKSAAKLQKAKARVRIGQEVHFEVDGKCHTGTVKAIDGMGKNPNLQVSTLTRFDECDTLYNINWFATREGSPPKNKFIDG